MKSIIDFIEQRSMLSHSENINEKQNFLIKGHTKKQTTIEDEEFYKKCISCIGAENKSIIKNFIDLMEALYNERWHEIESEDLSKTEAEAETEFFVYDLQDTTDRNNWYYNAYHNMLSAIRGTQKEKQAIINIICWYYIKFKNKNKQ